jgi:hypothetical protein
MTATLDTQTTALFEELDHRDSDGIEVSLLWSRTDNSLAVVVLDSKRDERFEFRVAADKALDAFQHPYAYAAARHVEPRPILETLAA